MDKRKLQAVINRLNDKIKLAKSDSKIYHEVDRDDYGYVENGKILGMKEAIHMLEMLKDSIK